MPVMLRTDQLDEWLSGAMPIEKLASLDFDCVGEPCHEEQPIKPDEGFEQLGLY